MGKRDCFCCLPVSELFFNIFTWKCCCSSPIFETGNHGTVSPLVHCGRTLLWTSDTPLANYVTMILHKQKENAAPDDTDFHLFLLPRLCFHNPWFRVQSILCRLATQFAWVVFWFQYVEKLCVCCYLLAFVAVWLDVGFQRIAPKACLMLSESVWSVLDVMWKCSDCSTKSVLDVPSPHSERVITRRKTLG